ncbi:hypothetical protein [Kitasatospora sp. NPDC057541]
MPKPDGYPLRTASQRPRSSDDEPLLATPLTASAPSTAGRSADDA